jgi:flagellar biosynthesis protein FlhF
MRIKTFYTKTMSEALRQVKENLGAEALILSTKEIPRRAGSWGQSSGFEVVAACDNQEDVDIYSSSQEVAAPIKKDVSLPARTAEDLAVTYSPALIAAKKGSKKQPKVQTAAIPSVPVAAEENDDGHPFKGRAPAGLYNDLVSCGVDAALARDLMAKAWESLSVGHRRSRAALVRGVAQAALNLVAPNSCLSGLPAKKVVAFVGPTGVGKTTSIAKLAAHLALQKKKKVLLMTLDGYRIGAIEQLRIYAGLMGIPFRFVDQVSELSRTIEENSRRDYILIDTAGRGPKDLSAMNELGGFLKGSQKIERHLVLSATMKESDMRKIMNQFEICGPDHLLFTKLDETDTPGPILNELVRTKKSFSYYTDGQKVPDDLHAFQREQIIDILLARNDNALRE